MEKFISLLLGTNDLPTYLAALFFAFLGVLIVLLINAQKRDKHSANTPYKFSISFLFWDNIREIMLGFLLILLALRFSIEYAGEELTMYYALGVGFGLQKISNWITNIEKQARK